MKPAAAAGELLEEATDSPDAALDCRWAYASSFGPRKFSSGKQAAFARSGRFSYGPIIMRGVPSAAKVTPPKPTNIEPRKRLHRRLNELRRAHQLCWIVAPAGSGKTALAATYSAKERVPTLWYRVDEGDLHAEDAFYYLRRALEALEGSRRAGVSLPSFSRTADLARFSRRFFEALFTRLPAHAMLVFDDFHFAPKESPWQSAIEKGLECIPRGMNVVVLSRSLPPATLARPHVHGDIGFLETAELLFTEDETIALGKRHVSRKGARLTAVELAEIHAATGGWPAGISLQLRENRPSSNHKLGADLELGPLFEYLANAVFAPLPAGTQQLLLHTACLQTFTAQQAEAISGVPGAHAALSALYHSGFFLERDDADTEIFRYHALFRSFLEFQALKTLKEEELSALHVSAAALLREAGRGEEAFELLLRAGAHEGLRDLTLSLAPCLFSDGRIALLERWLNALPPSLLEENAWLRYWRAMCLLTTAPAESRAGFANALAAFENAQDGTGAYLAWAGAVQALTYEGRAWREIDDWLGRLANIERTCPPFRSADVASQVASSLVMALALVGADSATIEHWCGRALSLAERTETPSARVMTASVLVLNYALRGDATEAARLVAELERGGQAGAGFLASVASRAAATTLAWHHGQAEASLAAAREGLAYMGERRVPMWQSAMLVFGSLAALDLNDLAQAQCFLEQLGTMAESGTPLEVSAFHAIRAHESVARGDLATGMVAIELAADHARSVGFPYGEGSALQLLAYLAFERGDAERGCEALEAAKRIDEGHRLPILRCWRLLLEADRARREGDRTRAIELLREGFTIGRQNQVYSLPCPASDWLAKLCDIALEEAIEPLYAQALIRQWGLPAPPAHLNETARSCPLHVYGIGRVEVISDGIEKPLGRARMLPLLLKAILSLGVGGAPVTASKLASLLWPEADGDAGMQVFEVTLFRLRKQLAPHGHKALRLEAGQVRLDTSVCWTDVDALHGVFDEISAIGSDASPPRNRARGLAERLLRLCERSCIQDDNLPPELFAIEELWRARAGSALLSLCQFLEGLDDDAGAERIYIRALEADVGSDSLLAPAVRCLVRRGRADEARAWIDSCRARGSRFAAALDL